MRRAAVVASSALAVLFTSVTSSPTLAQDRRDTAVPMPTREKQDSKTVGPVVYKPPLRGAPGGRVGGGTRGTSARDVFVLSALAPDHMGLTASEQPSLYWFISTGTSLPVEIAITDPQGVKPLLESRLTGAVERGVHRIDLAEHGVRLEPGVPYRWSVTVIPDEKRRSRDILAAATVERIVPPDELRARISTTPREHLPAVYAEAGLWYEALAIISDLIDRNPGDASLREQRAALLSQVGLPDIGEATR